MSKVQDGLNEIFDIATIPPNEEVEIIEAEEIEETESTQCDIDANADEDYEAARKNLVDLIEKGKDALDSAMAIAESSEHPRAFEVVGNLIQQMADLNEQLLRLTKQRQEIIEQRKSKNGGNTTINSKNTVFVGTPKDLNKMLREQEKK